jgi:uncharacterized protein (TIGR02391 family)
MFITNEQVDELLLKLADLSGLDAELAERCGILIRSQRYDEAVSRAFVVLEERLRELLEVRGGSGVDLAQKAFAPETGQLVDRLGLPRAENEGIRDLFVGAFKAFRNRAAHTVAGFSLEQAQSIIQLVNLLLLMLEQIRRASGQLVPERIAAVMAPGPKERLQLFLEGLQRIGIGEGHGKIWIPYRATLKCKIPSKKEPGPYRVSVLYLTLYGGKPALLFNSGGLSRVVGLDVKQLEAELLQAGCTRTAAKDTSIRLLMSEKNDQATFDRLYEILQDLMQKHGV